jgi:hypothetical protein
VFAMSLTPEEIEQNWQSFRNLCTKLGDRSPAVISMLEEVDERLCLCPASAKLEFHGAFPGGLVGHSLRVLNNLVALNRAFDWRLRKDSMIVGALFHDIGKLGMPGKDSENDFYQPQTDAWRADKRGEVYQYNNDLPFMTTPDRSVFIMQHYGIQLTPDEWVAIRCNDGFVWEPNRPYCLKLHPLAYGVMTADYHATCVEKGVRGWVHG